MTMQSSPSKYTELILVVLMSSILAGDSIFATESRGCGSWRLINNSYAQQLFRERKRGHFEYCVLKDDFLYCQAQSGMLFALARRGKDGSFELVQSELGESLAKTTHGKIELMGDPFLIESSADGDRLFVFFQKYDFVQDDKRLGLYEYTIANKLAVLKMEYQFAAGDYLDLDVFSAGYLIDMMFVQDLNQLVVALTPPVVFKDGRRQEDLDKMHFELSWLIPNSKNGVIGKLGHKEKTVSLYTWDSASGKKIAEIRGNADLPFPEQYVSSLFVDEIPCCCGTGNSFGSSILPTSTSQQSCLLRCR